MFSTIHNTTELKECALAMADAMPDVRIDNNRKAAAFAHSRSTVAPARRARLSDNWAHFAVAENSGRLVRSVGTAADSKPGCAVEVRGRPVDSEFRFVE